MAVPERSSRRQRRSPERQKLRDNRARLGQELQRLQEIPPIPSEEVPPARGDNLKAALGLNGDMGPYKHKLLCLVAAYADAGVKSPSMRALAARMSTTVPNVMFLLRALEHKGLLQIKWASEATKPNVYTIVWPDV